MPRTQLPHRPPSRRLRTIAVLTALLLHAAAVLFVPFPAREQRDETVMLFVPVDPTEMPPPLVSPDPAAVIEPAGAVEPAGPGAEEATAAGGEGGRTMRQAVPDAVARAIPFLPEPEARAPAGAPSAAMTEARAATLPLVVRPGGGFGWRRPGRTEEQLAIARAESLLVARLEGIAVVERRETGAVGLANGGITLAIPWGGFLPTERTDAKWREERCSGGGGDSDKAGEGEARRAQCD